MNRSTSLVVAAVALLAVPTAPAAAAEPTQGWWTVTATGGPVPDPLAPDVPPDGLFIQGGPDPAAPVAYAALVLPLAASSTPGTVTVRSAAPSALPGAVVVACPLLSASFEPQQGGPMAEAPPYDCAGRHGVPVGADGVTYSFDALDLVVDGAVAVALLPGSSTTRVVFEGAHETTLVLRPDPAGVTPTSRPAPAPADPNPGATAAPPAGRAAPTRRPDAVGTPSTAAAPSPSGATAAGVPTFRPAAATAAPVPSLPHAEPLAALLAIGAILVASICWSRSARPASAAVPEAMTRR